MSTKNTVRLLFAVVKSSAGGNLRYNIDHGTFPVGSLYPTQWGMREVVAHETEEIDTTPTEPLGV